MWFLKGLFEELVHSGLKWLVDQVGPFGDIALFLVVGLSLLVGGPVFMSRENRRRRVAERRPKYGWLEYVIVVLGGFAFTTVGLALLISIYTSRGQE
jgi:hypothetical protein